MKTRSKALLLSLCAVLLVAASVFGTMAYLTSNDSVVNTFTVGSVSITLDEADVKTDGTYETNHDSRVEANNYKLMPGHTYIKDPTIHVGSNSEDCYLFVKVVDEIAAIEGDVTVANQMAANGWVAVDGVENVYVYATDKTKPTAVSANSNVIVFDHFTVKGDVSNDENAETKLSDFKDMTITVTAYAVQKDGFESKTAAEIWNATFGNK